MHFRCSSGIVTTHNIETIHRQPRCTLYLGLACRPPPCLYFLHTPLAHLLNDFRIWHPESSLMVQSEQFTLLGAQAITGTAIVLATCT